MFEKFNLETSAAFGQFDLVGHRVSQPRTGAMREKPVDVSARSAVNLGKRLHDVLGQSVPRGVPRCGAEMA